MGEMEIPDELIDQLLGEYQGPEQLTGPDGLINQLRKRLIERAAGAELEQHLGYPPGAEPPEAQPNRRNGMTSKTLRTVDGPLSVELPRDRDASFEPRRRARLAEPPARGALRRRLPRRAAGVDPRPAGRAQEGRLRRCRRHARRRTRLPRPLDREDRGRPLLDVRHDRAPQPRRQGRALRLHRRPLGLPGGNRRRLPAGGQPDVRCPSRPPEPALPLLEGTQELRLR